MKLNTVGEFGLIEMIKKDSINDPVGIEIGIGDDAAAFWPADRRLQLLTADMLVESVHFDLAWISPRQLGYKSLAVNISDIAAMGGTPRHAAVSIALPQTSSVAFVMELYDGMKAIGREFGVNIIGGDTVSSPDKLVINVTLTGDVAADRMIRRSGAKPGDLVLVTGCLGDSAAGLELLQHKVGGSETLVRAHLTPKPQIAAGQAAAALGATAMDDISDGISSEANEIAAASQKGMRIYAADIPLSEDLLQYAASVGRDPLEYALFGGEDYQLLITMPPAAARNFCCSQPGGAKIIGEVIERPGVSLIKSDGSISQLLPQGFNHFR